MIILCFREVLFRLSLGIFGIFCTWMSVSLFKTESFQSFFLSIDSLILLRLLKCLYCIPTRCLVSLVSSLSHSFFLSFSFLLLWMSNFKWIVFKFRDEFFLLIKSLVTECFRQALYSSAVIFLFAFVCSFFSFVEEISFCSCITFSF